MTNQADAEQAAPTAGNSSVLSPPGCPVPRKDGRPCTAPPLVEGGTCFAHSPALVEQRALARATGAAVTKTRRVEIRVHLDSKGGVHDFLTDVARAVARGQVGASAGNTLNALANTALRLIEVEIEARLAALEVSLDKSDRQ